MCSAPLQAGGQLFPEPGGTINSYSVAALAWVLRTCVIRTGWRQAQADLDWMWTGAPPDFRFVYARMGYMVEEPTRGLLQAQTTLNNIPKGSVSYDDVAPAVLALAADPTRQWERKAIFFNYE